MLVHTVILPVLVTFTGLHHFFPPIMEDDVPNVARFRSYYDYLDSLIAEEDIRYLQDGELARLIAELGYRGTGKTLTEKEYLEEIEKIEMAKKLKEINENAEQAGDLLGPVEGESPLVTAIKQRYKDNKEGRMNSVLFIYTKSESEEISGHIDLSARC